MDKQRKQLLKEFAQKIVDRNKEWIKENRHAEKLYQHEAIKSFCLLFGSNGVTEYRKEYRNLKNVRNGRVDFVDDNFAVEIDDARNINAIRKLIAMEEEDGKIPLWIAHHFSEQSISKMKKEAARYKIPLLILYKSGHNNLYIPKEDDVRTTKRVKYKNPPKYKK